MKTKILLLSVFCLSLFGCNQGSVETIPSNTVMTSQIYQIYNVEGSRSEMNSVALFRVGGATGTTLELTAPGKVLYNSAEMSVSAPSNLVGTNYRMKGTDYRMSGKEYRAKHDFSFTDNDGKTYLNSINLSPLEIVSNSAFTLENNQPTTIPLSRAVGTDEKLTLAIGTNSEEEIPAADNSVYFNPSRNAVIITPKYWQTKNLRPKAELEIAVSKSATITQGTPLGGSISAKYSAAPIYVSVNNAKAATANTNKMAAANANTAPKSANANVKTLPKVAANGSNSNATTNNTPGQ
jgi:hypothetical protein